MVRFEDFRDQIVALRAEGKSDPAIADLLGIGRETVRRYRISLGLPATRGRPRKAAAVAGAEVQAVLAAEQCAQLSLADIDPALAWQYHAACSRITGPDLMYPERYTPAEVAQAFKVCRACPVQRICLDVALSGDEREGIWGCTTPNQRTAILHARRAQAASPGLEKSRTRGLSLD